MLPVLGNLKELKVGLVEASAAVPCVNPPLFSIS